MSPKKMSFLFEGGPSDPAPSDGGSDASLSQTPDAGSGPDAAPADRSPAPAKPAKPPRPSRKRKKKDPRQARMMVLMAVLVPVFLGVMYMAFQTPDPVKAAASTLTTDSPASSPASAAVADRWQPPAAWPGLERDPMGVAQPPAEPNEADGAELSPRRLVVRGIVISEGQSSAIVGGHIVFEGSVVRGATVRRILRDRVEFERDGETWTQQVQQ